MENIDKIIEERKAKREILNKARSEFMSINMKGEKNPRWNGGNSKYPNHAELKKIRIKVLQRAKGKCQICKERIAKIVHHIDENKSNHSINNLIAVCYECHINLHRNEDGKLSGKNRGRPSAKYNILYDMPIKEIAKKFGVTTSAVYYWIRNPEKKKWLEEQLKNKNV